MRRGLIRGGRSAAPPERAGAHLVRVLQVVDYVGSHDERAEPLHLLPVRRDEKFAEVPLCEEGEEAALVRGRAVVGEGAVEKWEKRRGLVSVEALHWRCSLVEMLSAPTGLRSPQAHLRNVNTGDASRPFTLTCSGEKQR